MESNLRPTPAAKPVAPYLGGKSRLAARIIERIRAIPHECYVEPFVGMGGVFLRRPFTAKCEVINDLDRDVSNLFRILQHHYVPLMDMLRWQLTSRNQFEWLLSAAPDSLTDLHRAARFLYLQRLAFGGKVARPGFGVSLGPARFDVHLLGATLQEAHNRLSRVIIECLPYDEILVRYDRPNTLFYLDPPYWGCERDYAAPFNRADFEKLASILESLRGRFMMSLNDRPEVRQAFAAFRIEAVETSYSVASTAKGRGKVGEVLISNE